MLELLAVVLAAGGLAAAQDMSAIVTDDSDNGLLAYTTITTACLPAVDPNNEPIFSIQTDTNIESCTYVVNADNTQQVVSTIGATTTPAPSSTITTNVPLSTIVGTNTESTSRPPITSSTTVSTGSLTSTSEPSNTSEATTTTEGGADESSATSEPAASPTDGAAGKIAMGGEVLGFVGFMAVLVAL